MADVTIADIPADPNEADLVNGDELVVRRSGVDVRAAYNRPTLSVSVSVQWDDYQQGMNLTDYFYWTGSQDVGGDQEISNGAIVNGLVYGTYWDNSGGREVLLTPSANVADVNGHNDRVWVRRVAKIVVDTT